MSLTATRSTTASVPLPLHYLALSRPLTPSLRATEPRSQLAVGVIPSPAPFRPGTDNRRPWPTASAKAHASQHDSTVYRRFPHIPNPASRVRHLSCEYSGLPAHVMGCDAPNDTLVTEEWYRFAPPALTSVDTEPRSIYNGPLFPNIAGGSGVGDFRPGNSVQHKAVVSNT